MTPFIIHVCRGREWRGGERQVALLAGTLHRRGLRQLVVTGRGTALARALAEVEIPVAELPWRIALDPRALRGLARQAAGRGSPVPLLHAHDSHALILAGLVARRYGLRLIATRRSATRPGRLGWWRRADRIVAISAAVRDRLVEAGIAPGQIAVIPSAVDLELLRQRPPSPWRPPGLGDAAYLVAVGALTPEKGHRVLLEAHARLTPRPLLVLVGDGRERQALAGIAGALGTARDVHFAGEVDDATPFIRGALALVQPSFREALGTAVLEALGLGTPVVASDTGGLSELLGGGAGTLVPPGDAGALAQALAGVLRAPGRRPEPPDLSRFSIGTVADQVAEMYTSAPDATER